MTAAIPPFQKKRAPKANWRALILLFLFFATLLLIIFFQSPLSRIQKIEVEGNHLLSDQDVVQLSQLKIGETYFLNVRTNDIKERVKTSPLIAEATISKNFPNLVSIHLTEAKPVAVINNGEGQMAYLLSTGQQVKMDRIGEFFLGPVISHMNVQQLKALADALNRLSPEVLESLSEIIPGSTPDELIIFTREQYEILTTWENLAGNLAIYPNLVEALARESADGKPVKGQIYLKEAKWFVPYEEQKKDQADH